MIAPVITPAEEIALAAFVERGCLIHRGEVYAHHRDARTVPTDTMQIWARRHWAILSRCGTLAIATPAAKAELYRLELDRTAYAQVLNRRPRAHARAILGEERPL